MMDIKNSESLPNDEGKGRAVVVATAAAAKKRSRAEKEESNSDMDSEGIGSDSNAADPTDDTSRQRREKRLAMNRESARARRKRKKVLIETLEQQVAELTKSNQKYRLRVDELEKELMVTKQTVEVLSRSPGRQGMQQSFELFGQRQALHPARGPRQPEVDSNDAIRRVIQAHHLSVPGHDAMSLGRSSASNAMTVEQLLRMQQLSHRNSSTVAPHSLSNSAARAAESFSSRTLGDAASRLGMVGLQDSDASYETALGLPQADRALSRERLLMLQQQGQQQQNPQASQLDATTRALLLQQLLQEHELLNARRRLGPGGT